MVPLQTGTKQKRKTTRSSPRSEWTVDPPPSPTSCAPEKTTAKAGPVMLLGWAKEGVGERRRKMDVFGRGCVWVRVSTFLTPFPPLSSCTLLQFLTILSVIFFLWQMSNLPRHWSSETLQTRVQPTPPPHLSTLWPRSPSRARMADVRAFKRKGESVGFVGVEGCEGLKDVLVGCDGLETFVRFLLSFESNPEGFNGRFADVLHPLLPSCSFLVLVYTGRSRDRNERGGGSPTLGRGESFSALSSSP